MDKPFLSVITPGIRNQYWERAYNSVIASTSVPFEHIFIGPYPLPDSLKDKNNVIYIEDWGSPIRAQQIGLTKARGKYVTWLADDFCALPQAIDKGFQILENNGFNELDVLVQRYLECDSGELEELDKPVTRTDSRSDNYYQVDTFMNLPYCPRGCLLFMGGLIQRQLLLHVGGWDCVNFDSHAMSYFDLGLRLYLYGANMILEDQVTYIGSHLPGTTGDHFAIHTAMKEVDEPYFNEKWQSPQCLDNICIDINNWEIAPARWERRFGHA